MLLNSNNDKYTVNDNTYNGNYLETRLSIDNIEIDNDADVNTPVTISLRDIYNSKVLEGNLAVSINDVKYQDFLVDEGVATISIPHTEFPKDSVSSLKAEYSTNTLSYQPTSSTVTVTPFTNTSIKVTYTAPDDEVVNKTITYKINLTDFQGTELKGKTVNVTVNGTTQEYTTGENGLSDGIIEIPIIYDANGDKTIRVQYLGDEFYNHTTAELEHYVRKINTNLTVTVPDGTAPEDTVLINFTLKDEYGNTIPNKNVTIRILDGSIEKLAKDVEVNGTGEGNITFTPDIARDYEVEVIFKDENDSVHNYSIVKSSLSVNKIHSESTLFDDFDKTVLTTHFSVRLFGVNNGEGLADKPITIYVTIDKDDGTSTTLAYPNARTNSTGYYDFTATRTDVTDNITVKFSYAGDNRYVGTAFDKPFNGLLIMLMNITATDTYINVTNNFSINVTDAAGNRINGSFYITREDNDNDIIATVDVINGTGYYDKYLNDTYQESVVFYGGFVNESYIRVYQMLTFKVEKIPTRISVEVLNETVYNTTLKVNITVPTSDYPELDPNVQYNITGLNVTVKHKSGNSEVGTAEVVNGSAIITLVNVDKHQDYDLIIDYDGNDYFQGREHEIKVKPEKLPVTLTPIVDTNIAGKVRLRVNVTSDHDPSVENGTVTVYLDESWEAIGSGHVHGGYTYIDIAEGYLDKIGTYPIDIRYNNSATFKDADVDYDLLVVGRYSTITPSVNNTVIHNVTADVVLTDTETGALLTNSNITAYNSKGQVIGRGTTDANGFATILLNFTQTGPHVVNFTYVGNTTYRGSSALLPITVDYRNASIVEEILNNVTDNVTIKVNLTDRDNGTPITKGDIAVLFKDGIAIKEIEIDNEDGIVIFEELELPVGNNSLIIRLKNDGTYDDTDHEITVGVEYRNLTIDFEQDNKYVTESTISVSLKDKDDEHRIIDGRNVAVYDSKGLMIGKGIVQGLISINLPAGNHTITVTYPRSNHYNETSVTKEVEILKYETYLTVQTNVSSTALGNVVNISGVLSSNSELREYIIPNTRVFISVNGTEIGSARTNDMGYYEFNYTTSIIGNMSVNVSFEETDIYRAAENATSFNVTKIPTVTNVSIVNNTAGHVMIEVTTTDNNGNPVSGTVNVTFSNGTEIVTTAINGKINVTIPSVDDSTLEVNVTFLEDDTYLSSVGVDSTSILDNSTIINVE
jgi:hypothetical protein